MKAFATIFLGTLAFYIVATIAYFMDFLRPEFIKATLGTALLIAGFYLMLCKPASKWIIK